MSKPILVKPNATLWRSIREAAKAEKRKPGPMVLILLERWFASNNIAEANGAQK